MKTLDPKLTNYLLRECQKRTKARTTDRFAISYNTLRKIEAGMPLRASVAMRLEEKLQAELSDA